jgi:hypothetical protein
MTKFQLELLLLLINSEQPTLMYLEAYCCKYDITPEMVYDEFLREDNFQHISIEGLIRSAMVLAAKLVDLKWGRHYKFEGQGMNLSFDFNEENMMEDFGMSKSIKFINFLKN